MNIRIAYGNAAVNFAGSKIRNPILTRYSEPMCNELAIDTLTFTIVTATDVSAVMRRNATVTVTGTGYAVNGDFVITEVSDNNDGQYKVTAQCSLDVLDKANYGGDVYSNATVQTILDDILLGTTLTVAFTDQSLLSKRMSGYIPECTKREALQLLLFALNGTYAGANEIMATTDVPSGISDIVVTSPDSFPTTEYYTPNLVFENGRSIDIAQPLSKITVHQYTYTARDPESGEKYITVGDTVYVVTDHSETFQSGDFNPDDMVVADGEELDLADITLSDASNTFCSRIAQKVANYYNHNVYEAKVSLPDVTHTAKLISPAYIGRKSNVSELGFITKVSVDLDNPSASSAATVTLLSKSINTASISVKQLINYGMETLERRTISAYAGLTYCFPATSFDRGEYTYSTTAVTGTSATSTTFYTMATRRLKTPEIQRVSDYLVEVLNPIAGITYTWYNGDTSLGAGTFIDVRNLTAGVTYELSCTASRSGDTTSEKSAVVSVYRYTLTTAKTHVTLDTEPLNVYSDRPLTMVAKADGGYNLPQDITVTNADYYYNQSTGIIVLYKPTGSVTVVITAVGGDTLYPSDTLYPTNTLFPKE